MKHLFVLGCIFQILTGTISVFSQTSEVTFTRYSIADGLSNDIVRSITQDRYGFIWIGTEDGLNRFDGYTFQVYKHNPFDSSSIVSNDIQSLCCDSSGNIWIGTTSGLDRYDRAEDKFIHFEHAHENLETGTLSITSLAVDRNGFLWIGTMSGGLTGYDPVKEEVYRFRHDAKDSTSIPGDSITCLCPSADGTVWIGLSSSHLSVYHPSERRFETFASDPGNPHSYSAAIITSICQDQTGSTWISTFGDGLLRYDDTKGEFAHYRNDPGDPRSLGDNTVSGLAADGEGRLWLSTYTQGVDRYDGDGKGFTHCPNNPSNPLSISSPRIYTVYADRMGSVWIGAWRGGLNVYHPWQRKFALFRHIPLDNNSLNGDTVWAVCEDGKGRLWIGTEAGGLDCYNPAEYSFTHHVHADRDKKSLSANYVIQICEDHNGQIWAGTYGGGLDQYDEERNIFIHHRRNANGRNTLLSDSITTLFVDSDNQIWIGFDMNRIERYDPTKDTFYVYGIMDSARGIGSQHETESIIEDHDGHLWIGTFGGGLFSFDKATAVFHSYSAASSDPHFLPYTGIYSLAIDAAGALWVGTFAGGLFRYDSATQTFQQFSEFQGLASNYIKGIVPDRHGKLWLSSIKGLSLFDPGQNRVRNFDVSDGLQGIDFRRGACCSGRHGVLYFGGIRGLNYFDPDSIRDNPLPPRIILTAFKVFDQPLRAGKPAEDLTEVELSYEQNFFTIEFVALGYTVPSKNCYAYRLEGFDHDWEMCGTRRFASYTHLDGGQYLFRVKACNNDGIWNDAGRPLVIIIHPPFWATWWFRGMVLVLIAGIPVMVYRYRTNKLLGIERTRSRIARDLHDELSATVSGINFFAQAITKDGENRISGNSRKLLGLIHESTSSLQESISDIIWSVNPGHDRWEDILAKCRRYASDLFDARGIACEYKIPEPLPTHPLAMEVRRNFWLCYKEMVTNIVRHSQCRHVSVSLQFDSGKRALLEIRDDGRGFNPEAPTTGNGVINIHARARNLRGEVKLVSEPGKGTCWRLRFPF